MTYEILDRLNEILRSGSCAVLVTIVGVEGSSPARVGGKMLVTHDESLGTIGGGALEQAALREASEILISGRSQILEYKLSEDPVGNDATSIDMLCGGNVKVFFEYIPPRKRLYIWGGGHVGKALAGLMNESGFDITIIDNREVTRDSIRLDCRIVIDDYNSAMEGVSVNPGGYFVIATHEHEYDFTVLKRIYESKWEPAYIGMVASRKKREAIIDKLNVDLEEKPNIDLLYTPAGLDLGGNTPFEIALSIASEIIALSKSKIGHRHLRDL